MAQTKRKRRPSKHRGNAAGMIEARGRTGRKPTVEERKVSDRELAAERRRQRMMRPPSWKTAAPRAALAAIAFGLMAVFLLNQSIAQAVVLTFFVFLFYVPLGYYTDMLLYKRRMRQEAKAKT